MDIRQPTLRLSFARGAISTLLLMAAAGCSSSDDESVAPQTVSPSSTTVPATVPVPLTAGTSPTTVSVPSNNITLPSISVPDSAASQLAPIATDLERLEIGVPTTEVVGPTESTRPADERCAHPAENREQLTAFAAETVDGLMGELVLAQLADIQDWEAACKRSDVDAAAVLAENITQRGKLIRERRDEVG